MNEGAGFDDEGVARNNPHLRRVMTDMDISADEVTVDADVDLDAGKGIYVTVPCSDQAFTVSVDGPGTFTFDTQDAKGVIGIEWVGDE